HRRVAHLGWVEHRDIRLHTRPQQPAIHQAEALRREGGHLPHGVREREYLALPHVYPQHPGERAVAARVRVGLPANRNLSVRSDHGRGMAENALEILFLDRMENALTAALFDNPESGFRGVFDGRIHSALPSDLSQ